MSFDPPPIQNPIIETEKSAFGKLASQWILFMNQIYTGDTGTNFTPTYANLTTVGTPTVTGSYYKSGAFMDFEIHITPGTNTSATAGSTYFQLPFDVLSDGGCFIESGLVAAVGAVDAASNRVYPSSWSAVSAPLTIMGRVRAA